MPLPVSRKIPARRAQTRPTSRGGYAAVDKAGSKGGDTYVCLCVGVSWWRGEAERGSIWERRSDDNKAACRARAFVYNTERAFCNDTYNIYR